MRTLKKRKTGRGSQEVEEDRTKGDEVAGKLVLRSV